MLMQCHSGFTDGEQPIVLSICGHSVETIRYCVSQEKVSIHLPVSRLLAGRNEPGFKNVSENWSDTYMHICILHAHRYAIICHLRIARIQCTLAISPRHLHARGCGKRGVGDGYAGTVPAWDPFMPWESPTGGLQVVSAPSVSPQWNKGE